MHLLTAASLNDDALTAAFNTVYEQYLVPLRFTVQQLQQHIMANAIQPEHSPVWLDNRGAVAGLALLGLRDQRGWVGGFGIAPAYRGQGLGHRLIGAVLASVHRLGLAQVQLEVLTGNTSAIAVYRAAGFVHRRDLRIWTWNAPRPSGEQGSTVIEADAARLLAHAPRLHDSAPSWQREPAGIAATAGLAGLGLGSADVPSGYAIYQAGDSGVRVVDIAAATPEAAGSLLDALAERFPDRRMSLSNEPAESRLSGVLEQRGWREVLRQHEMVYTTVGPGRHRMPPSSHALAAADDDCFVPGMSRANTPDYATTVSTSYRRGLP